MGGHLSYRCYPQFMGRVKRVVMLLAGGVPERPRARGRASGAAPLAVAPYAKLLRWYSYHNQYFLLSKIHARSYHQSTRSE